MARHKIQERRLGRQGADTRPACAPASSASSRVARAARASFRRAGLRAGMVCCTILALGACAPLARALVPTPAPTSVSADAGTTDRLLQAARTLSEMGEDAPAAQLAARAAETARTRPDLWLYAGALAARAGDAQGAERARGTAARLGSQDPEARLALARLTLREGRFEAAARLFADVAGRLPPGDPRGLIGAGVALDGVQRHAEAQRFYQSVLRRDPGNAAARSNLGLSLVMSGRPEAGLALLRLLAAQSPAYAPNLAEAENLAHDLAQGGPVDGIIVAPTPTP